jgi:hypothetical protein
MTNRLGDSLRWNMNGEVGASSREDGGDPEVIVTDMV